MTVTQCMGCNAASLFSRTVWPQALALGISAPLRLPVEASVQVVAMTITQCMVCNGGRKFPPGCHRWLAQQCRKGPRFPRVLIYMDRNECVVSGRHFSFALRNRVLGPCSLWRTSTGDSAKP